MKNVLKQQSESECRLFENKTQCCGCSACFNVCPSKAITMCEDEEGFLYPKIDNGKCIHCNLCEKVCAFKVDQEQHTYIKGKETLPVAMAVKHKNFDVRINSRSGGVFTAVTDYVLSQGGAVYGAILADDFHVKHIKAVAADERNLMRGSKYVQSEMGDIFQNVKADLECGRLVLFSGTSCQVAGLKKFLRKDYENLFCMDIVCHGVPSPLVWKKYLSWQEAKHGKCVSVDFRNKKDYGWIDHVETLTFNKGGKVKKINSRVYTELFYGHAILRPACYECPYKSIYHPGDITIADFWGIEKAVPGFSDNKGVSLVLINTLKGEKYFQYCKEDLEFIKTEIEKCLQPPLVKPFPKPENREKFWKDINEKPFEYIANLYGRNGLKFKLKKLYHKIKDRTV